ncbi:phage tail protein [Methanobrevibacter olleyae]|uniref:Phage tail tape measure protein n=1 Tax=Methanobrevibacter olleyae TaxID=294671 RepID=A0A126R2R0_METOL|nr:hypothetical protein [Methanobrevibacter olleyae]AMK16326.1 phage tail tape measure protein [Methanobrevibacter olleyae]
MAKRIDLDVNIDVDSGDLEKVQKILKEIETGEVINVDTDVDSAHVETVKKEIDDMKGDKVPIDVDVDDSEIKKAQKELENLKNSIASNTSGMGSAITGVVSGLAGKSIWDVVYGTSAKAETNKVLLKNMSDLKTSSETLYDTINTTTDNSLISMQSLIPALNGIKSATGATATEIDTASTKVASFGQYVYAMTGSEAKAEQAMFDLSKGIKGAYASLDQYGITEEALMRTKLWSGKEDDLDGYLDAVNAVTGSTDELMDTATGMEALLGKSFSRAGKNIGAYVLPQVKNVLNGFNELDASTKGWLSTAILVGGGIGSSVVGGLSALNQAQMGYDALRGSVETVRGVFSGVKGAIDTVRNAESIAAGVTQVLTGAKTLQTAAEEGNMLAKLMTIGPTITLAGAEMALLLPIVLVAGAILVLIGILWYLYNNNETVRKSIDGLISMFQGWITTIFSTWEAITQGQGAMGLLQTMSDMLNSSLDVLFGWLTQIGGFLPTAFIPAWDNVIEIFMSVGLAIDELLSVFQSFLNGQMSITDLLVNVWEIYSSMMENIFNNIIDGLKNFASGFLQLISDMLNSAWDSLFGWLDQIGSFIPTSFIPAWDNVIEIFMSVGLAIDELITVFQLFLSGQKSLTELLGDIWQIFVSMMKNIFNNIISFIINFAIGFKVQATNAAKGFVDNIIKQLTQLPTKVQNAVSGITNILTKPFTDAWVSINGTLSKISSGLHTISGGLLGVEYEGFTSTNSVGYEGFNSSGTLNSSLTSIAKTSTSSKNITFNNNFNGIIEEDASKYIVDTMSNYVKKQNLIRGV